MKQIAWVKIRLTVYLFIFFLSPYLTSAQKVNLFVHLDKSIYQPQENILFSGYVLNRDADLMSHQNILYVALIDPVNRTPVLKRRFQIKNGLGRGFLTLPDTIAAGEYWFVGYTNALLETGDQPVFRKLITVRAGASPFRIDEDTLEEAGENIQVRYKISTASAVWATGGKFTYTLYDSSNVITSGEKTINDSGEVIIPVCSKMDIGKYRDLTATITHKGLSKKIFLPILTAKHTVSENRGSFEQDNHSVAMATIIPGTAEYHQRTKVTLHIHVRDSLDQPMAGIFSVAVAASSKAGSSCTQNIHHYEAALNQSLLPANLKALAGEMSDYGYVLCDENKVKKPVSLALMGSNFTSFQTNSAGRFALPCSALVTSPGEVNYISVTDKSPERYKIMVYSRADTFDRQLAMIHYPLPVGFQNASQESNEADASCSSSMLKAAVVRAVIKIEFNALTGQYNSRNCGQDYVCTHHHGGPNEPDVLNCPYIGLMGNSEKIKPMEGATYMYTSPKGALAPSGSFAFVIYHCAAPTIPEFMKALDPVLNIMPFQAPPDREKGCDGTQSTVYWNHRLITNKNGDLDISFDTNDRLGDFTCILQGVSPMGVIQGACTYRVTPTNNPIASATILSRNLGGAQ
jgi:hypothetical protein